MKVILSWEHIFRKTLISLWLITQPSVTITNSSWKWCPPSRIPAFTRCLLLFVLCISPLFIRHLFILQLCSFFKAQLTCHLFFKAFPKTHKQKDSSELIYSFSVFMAEMPSWNYLKNVHRSQTVELLILVWWFLAGKIASLPFSISSCIKWRYYN